tara:strand:- start:99 stop:320 length:222 start_codon:yes stop_codon:yes gene_type:complete
MTIDIINTAFAALSKPIPDNHTICIYRSGLLDSAEVMQLLLEIEMESELRLDLANLMDGDVSVQRLLDALLQQ